MLRPGSKGQKKKKKSEGGGDLKKRTEKFKKPASP